jgi:hypothetical protein
MKCLPQALVGKTLSPAGGSIFGSGGNFKRWGLTGEMGHLRHAFAGYTWSLVPSLSPTHQEMNSLCHLLLLCEVLPHHGPRITRTKEYDGNL